jgi:hypothetical protein
LRRERAGAQIPPARRESGALFPSPLAPTFSIQQHATKQTPKKVDRSKDQLFFASESSLTYLDGTLPGDFGFDPLGLVRCCWMGGGGGASAARFRACSYYVGRLEEDF